MLGGQAVGKTALVTRYVENSFMSAYNHTLEDKLFEKRGMIDQEPCAVELLDTCGYGHGWMKFRPTDNSVRVVLVYSTCNRSSFKLIQKAIYDMKLPSQVTLVGTMKDRSDARVVTEKEGWDLASQWGITFFETSAKDGTGVEQAFASLVGNMWKDGSPTPIPTEGPALTQPNLVSFPPALDHMAYYAQRSPNAVSYPIRDSGQSRKVSRNEMIELRSGFDEPGVSILLNFWHGVTSWMCGVGR